MCRIARERIPSSMTDNERVTAGLRERLLGTWRELLGPASSCALALYPDHWNAGDAAIWWGTRRALAELGVEVAYACDPVSYTHLTLPTKA